MGCLMFIPIVCLTLLRKCLCISPFISVSNLLTLENVIYFYLIALSFISLEGKNCSICVKLSSIYNNSLFTYIKRPQIWKSRWLNLIFLTSLLLIQQTWTITSYLYIIISLWWVIFLKKQDENSLIDEGAYTATKFVILFS